MERSFPRGNSCFHPKVILAFFLLLCIGLLPALVASQPKKPMAVPVKVEKVVQKTVRPFISLIGTAEPYRRSTVASEVEGPVIDFYVRLGQRIKKGQVLARIEKTPLILALKQAEASLAEVNENYKNALSELQRNEELFKKKTISIRRYDVAKYSANALKQKILALEAKIEVIQYNVARCSIEAPFSGFVVEEHTQVGQWLQKGGTVVTIAEMDPILVTVPMPDRYIRFVKPGQTVDLKFAFLAGNKKREGSVRGILREGNEKSRTFPVQITVENNSFSIMAGMSCGVSFSVGRPYPSLLINKDAVVTSSDSHHIFIVKDGKAHLVPIKKGQAYGGHIAVEGDLLEGQPVVVEGNERLRPGQAVRVIGN